jgi:hypothetical protein
MIARQMATIATAATPPQSAATNKIVPATMVVPWRTLAVASAGVAIAGIAGLSVALALVATSKDADALATLALALAVTSFIIQIIVFIAQMFATNRQASRSEETYAGVLGLLEGLKGTTAGTQETLQRHMDVLLRAATGAAAEVGAAEKFDPAAFEQRVLQLVRDQQRSDLSTTSLAPPGLPTRPREPNHPHVIELKTWPADEADGTEALAVLHSLSPGARNGLEDLAGDEIRSRSAGVIVGYGRDTVADADELDASGLIRSDNDERAWTTLTPLGRRVGRLLAAQGPRPDWMPEER